jgi:putative tryptophan/tyrosine transport system substrate-binding protein
MIGSNTCAFTGVHHFPDIAAAGPTKYETMLDLKTVKVLGLDVPPTLLARADEVIE